MELIAQRFTEYFGARYQIQAFICDTIMSSVYQGVHRETGRTIAIKILKPQVGALEESIDRFYFEGQTLSTLDHPNLVKVHEVTGNDMMHFITMEFIDGMNLHQLIKQRGGQVAFKEVLSIVRQINSALAYIHNQGKIHRDIKASNIMVDSNNRAILLDFGIARDTRLGKRLTIRGTLLGTIEYMSPEQVTGEYDVDHRTDIWSMGVVLYELLAGRLPFRGDSMYETAELIKNSEPRRLDEYNTNLTPQCIEVVHRSLEKDRDLRYQRIEDQTLALEKAEELTDIVPIPVPYDDSNQSPGDPARNVYPIHRVKWLHRVFIIIISLLTIVSLFMIMNSSQDLSTKVLLFLITVAAAAIVALFGRIMTFNQEKLDVLEKKTTGISFSDFFVPIISDGSSYLPGSFKIKYGIDKGKTFRLPGLRYADGVVASLGRSALSSPQSNYHLKVYDRDNLRSVSRDQLELYYNGTDIIIKNKSRVNPIYVDEKKLSTDEQAMLNNNSIIIIGPLEFEYCTGTEDGLNY